METHWQIAQKFFGKGGSFFYWGKLANRLGVVAIRLAVRSPIFLGDP